MDYRNPSERFSFAAQWILDRLKWVGSTTYDPVEGIVLDLHRRPSRVESWPSRHSGDGLRATVGVEVNGTPYTAFDSFVSEGPSKYGFGPGSGGQTCKVFANHLLIGAKISSARRRVFTGLTISSPSLVRWSAASNIKVSRTDTPSPGVSATYTKPQELEFEIDKVGAAKITWSCSEPGISPPSDRVVLAELASLTISFSRPWSFTEVQHLAYPLILYFSFAENAFTHRTEFAVRLGAKHTSPNQLLLRQQVSTGRQSMYGKVYFTLHTLNGNVAASISQWVRKYRECETALGAYFTTRLQRPDVHLRFLYMAQCVEALGRSMFPLPEPTQEENESLSKALRKAYKDATSKDFRRQYSARIGNFHDLGRPTFRERLNDLPSRYPEEFNRICPQFADLVPAIVTWRNDITHRNPIGRINQATVDELLTITDALRFALELMILDIMCVPPAARRSALSLEFSGILHKPEQYLRPRKKKAQGKKAKA